MNMNEKMDEKMKSGRSGMKKGGMLLLHVKNPGPDVGRGRAPSMEYAGPLPTKAVAAEQGGAALSPGAKAGPPYCGELGGSLAAVALGLSLRRSLASPAVHTVNLHGAIAFTPLCLLRFLLHFASPLLFLHPSLPSSILVVCLLI